MEKKNPEDVWKKLNGGKCHCKLEDRTQCTYYKLACISDDPAWINVVSALIYEASIPLIKASLFIGNDTDPIDLVGSILRGSFQKSKSKRFESDVQDFVESMLNYSRNKLKEKDAGPVFLSPGGEA